MYTIFHIGKWAVLLFMSCMLLTPAHAHIYKWMDDAGHIYYGDHYPEGIHPYMIIVPPHPTANHRDIDRHQSIREYLDAQEQRYAEPEKPYYEYIRIISPAGGGTIRSNTGDFDVTVATSPQLKFGAGHKVLLTIDGRAVSRPQTSTGFHLTNISRGAHTLQAFIVSKDSEIILQSDAVTVFIMRQSLLGPWPPQPAPNFPAPNYPKSQ